jgi:hypothetical protein
LKGSPETGDYKKTGGFVIALSRDFVMISY